MVSGSFRGRAAFPIRRAPLSGTLPGSIYQSSHSTAFSLSHLPLSILSISRTSATTSASPTSLGPLPSSTSITSSSTTSTSSSLTPTSSSTPASSTSPILSSTSSSAATPSSSTQTNSLVTSSALPTTSLPLTMSSTTSSSSSTTQTAGAALASSSSNHTGAIVGGVIGGVIFLLLVIGGLLYYLRISRQAPSPSRRRSLAEYDSRGNDGKWNGLSSRDSTMDGGPRGAKRASGMQMLTREQADSLGNVASPRPSHTEQRNDSGGTEEDIESLGEEIKVSPTRGSVYVEPVPSLPYGSLPSPDVNGSFRRGRKPSTDFSARAVALERLNTNAVSALPSPPPARHRPDDRSEPDTPPRLSRTFPATPQTPVTPFSAEPMQRTSSASVRRNPSRKPVPAYDATAFGAVDGPRASRSSTTVAATASLAPSRPSQSSRDSTGSSTPMRGPTPSRSKEDLASKPFNVPQLTHKTSFGDARPMHYLVPDLPPTSNV
ncbi:uncharacterized protein FIBRA_03261 [Fibroporia radiculosa]|uniref:Uncharacterized protein n=1 Tax=Fibroporia radiculosa TaxID=599839 RepID=J4G4S8_9APHY|nr:uncharacterized protein FIBRA_03261 [Fibroporia radiculosa]CCM01213.1 predicted protein [Fibroporia radiculosa]